MEVNLDQRIVADNKQAIAFEVRKNVVMNVIFGQVLAVDEKLGIKLEFKLFHKSGSPLFVLIIAFRRF